MVYTICEKQIEGVEMGLDKCYRLIIKQGKNIIDKSANLTMAEAIFHLLNHLVKLNALCCADEGVFVLTKNPFTKEIAVKRFLVTVNIPYTELLIKKENKGSINEDIFLSTLKLIKEKYYEGI